MLTAIKDISVTLMSSVFELVCWPTILAHGQIGPNDGNRLCLQLEWGRILNHIYLSNPQCTTLTPHLKFLKTTEISLHIYQGIRSIIQEWHDASLVYRELRTQKQTLLWPQPEQGVHRWARNTKSTHYVLFPCDKALCPFSMQKWSIYIWKFIEALRESSWEGNWKSYAVGIVHK